MNVPDRDFCVLQRAGVVDCTVRGGGPTDLLARLSGQHMSQSPGVQIVVKNVTGVGGTIGSGRVAKAAPDCYTMVMGNLGTHAASMGLCKNRTPQVLANLVGSEVVKWVPVLRAAREVAD
jgi:tripartite-type tricarboxylate transporter receptor subunit TctC